jgi:hypothetical protein
MQQGTRLHPDGLLAFHEEYSYRKITFTNPIGKLIEKLHLCRNTQNICKTQSALQKGFTRGESPTIAALIVTELFTEAIENNKSMHSL